MNALKILMIHRAELTQAELTQGRVDSGAELTSGRVDPLPLATRFKWLTVTQEFWVRNLADPKYFPLGITSLVAAVIR